MMIVLDVVIVAAVVLAGYANATGSPNHTTCDVPMDTDTTADQVNSLLSCYNAAEFSPHIDEDLISSVDIERELRLSPELADPSINTNLKQIFKEFNEALLGCFDVSESHVAPVEQHVDNIQIDNVKTPELDEIDFQILNSIADVRSNEFLPLTLMPSCSCHQPDFEDMSSALNLLEPDDLGILSITDRIEFPSSFFADGAIDCSADRSLSNDGVADGDSVSQVEVPSLYPLILPLEYSPYLIWNTPPYSHPSLLGLYSAPPVFATTVTIPESPADAVSCPGRSGMPTVALTDRDQGQLDPGLVTSNTGHHVDDGVEQQDYYDGQSDANIYLMVDNPSSQGDGNWETASIYLLDDIYMDNDENIQEQEQDSHSNDFNFQEILMSTR